MGSGTGWLPVALLLLAASVLSPQAAATAAGEAEHAVQQHSERISGIPPLFFISKRLSSKADAFGSFTC
jgi:hypothetical protein